MEWDSVPTEPPSRVFAVGDVFEDQKAVYQVLEPCEVQGVFHKYKCKVVQRKQPVPRVQHHTFTDVEWVMILKQNEHLITLCNSNSPPQ
jgi:hypothetical protein